MRWDRVSGLAAATILAANLLATTRIPCLPPSPRGFVSGAQLIARATPVGLATWRIDQVLFGAAPASGVLHSDIALVGGCIRVEVGKTYLISERCPGGSSDEPCVLTARRIEDAAGDLGYLHARHVEDWAALIGEIKRWTEGATTTARFSRWIRSADTDESDRHSGPLLLIRYLESMTAELEWIERYEPEIAKRVRSGVMSRGIRELDVPTVPTHDDVDRVMTAIGQGREWRSAFEEAYRLHGTPPE
jgi:hypothetical protein